MTSKKSFTFIIHPVGAGEFHTPDPPYPHPPQPAGQPGSTSLDAIYHPLPNGFGPPPPSLGLPLNPYIVPNPAPQTNVTGLPPPLLSPAHPRLAPSAPLPHIAPIPAQFQTPSRSVPKFYDPEEFRRFTELSGASSASALKDRSKITFKTPNRTESPDPAFGVRKRGPYSERITQHEEADLIRICHKYEEKQGGWGKNSKWWNAVAMEFNLRRKQRGMGEASLATMQRKVEVLVRECKEELKRREKVGESPRYKESPELIEELDVFVNHAMDMESGRWRQVKAKHELEAELEEIEEVAREEMAEITAREPLKDAEDSAAEDFVTNKVDEIAGNDDQEIDKRAGKFAVSAPPFISPVIIPGVGKSPSSNLVGSAPSAPYVTTNGYDGYNASPPGKSHPSFSQQHTNPRPSKRRRLDREGDTGSRQVEALLSTLTPALIAMADIAKETHEWWKKERGKTTRSMGKEKGRSREACSRKDEDDEDEEDEELWGSSVANRTTRSNTRYDLLLQKVATSEEASVRRDKREKERDAKMDKLLNLVKQRLISESR